MRPTPIIIASGNGAKALPEGVRILKRGGAALDTLLGTKSVREGLERGESVDAILKRDEPAIEAFRREREAALLY